VLKCQHQIDYFIPISLIYVVLATMQMNILVAQLALLASGTDAAAAFMRFACNQLLVERLDP
jgi:hypothetical protein